MFRNTLTFIDAKIEAVPDFANLRFVSLTFTDGVDAIMLCTIGLVIGNSNCQCNSYTCYRYSTSRFLVEFLNGSLTLGVVPTAFKLAYITPLLKKVNLNPANARSYRPISYLSVLSKLMERIVARQLIDYLKSSKLLPRLQSAYRSHHETETAVLRVLADILGALD